MQTNSSSELSALLSSEKRSVGIISLIAMLRMFGLFALLPVLSLYVAQFDGATPMLIGFAVGAYGLGELGLPEKLCNAIAYHHDPDGAEEDSPLVRVAADAVTVADAIRLAGEDTDPHSDELADVSERVKMPADDLLTYVVANVDAARHFANG